LDAIAARVKIPPAVSSPSALLLAGIDFDLFPLPSDLISSNKG